MAKLLPALAGLAVLAAASFALQAGQAPAYGELLISEVMYYGEDWVELYNRAGHTISLAGCKLLTANNRAGIALSGELAAGGFLVVTVPGGLMDTGEHVFALGSNGFILDQMSYGNRRDTNVCKGLSAGPGQSLQFLDLAAGAGSCGYVAAGPTRGGPPPTPTPTATATATPTATPTPTATLPPGSVLLTEIYYQGGSASEWVELYNPGASPLSLEGWQLWDGEGTSSFSAALAPGEVLLVTGRDGALTPACAAQVVRLSGLIGNGLAEGGDELELRDAAGRQIDAIAYGNAAVPTARAGLSLARFLEPGGLLAAWSASQPGPGCLQPAPTPTPTPTATATPTATPVPTATVAAGAVLLTEIYYQGPCASEWVEIANFHSEALTLVDWVLSDNFGRSTFTLTLPPGGVAALRGKGSSLQPRCQAQDHILASSCIGNGLADSGDRLELRDATGRLVDAASYGTDATHGSVPLAPIGQSLARFLGGSTLTSWQPSEPDPGCLQPAPMPSSAPSPGATPAATPLPVATEVSSPQAPPLPGGGSPLSLAYIPAAFREHRLPEPPAILISEVLYEGAAADEGDEFVELRNYTESALPLSGYKLGDAEYQGDGEGMYAFAPEASIPPRAAIVVARCAASFRERFLRLPDYELRPGACPDTPEVPDLSRYTSWGRGSFSLANSGDEVLLLGPDDALLDAVAFGSGLYSAVGLKGAAAARKPLSLQRVAALDRDDMSLDFTAEPPSPGAGLDLPAPPSFAPQAPSWGGLQAYWGNLHAHTSLSDGVGPPELAFARARAAGMHFYALTDHAHMLRPEEWRAAQNATCGASAPGSFVALLGFEWTHPKEGHVNVYGVRELTSHEQPSTADVQGLLGWLVARPDSLAQVNHPGLGGSFVTARPGSAAQVRLQEVGNGNPASKPYRTFQEELLLAWANGWHLAPTIGSDTHDWRWGADTRARTGIWARELAEGAVLEALREGRVFATEDEDLALGWRCGEFWMGATAPAIGEGTCRGYYWDAQGEPGTATAYSLEGRALWELPLSSGQEFALPWPGSVRALWLGLLQEDGDMAWAPPIWLEGSAGS